MTLGFVAGGYVEIATTPLMFVHRGYLRYGDAPIPTPTPEEPKPLHTFVLQPPPRIKSSELDPVLRDDNELLTFLQIFIQSQKLHK
jgi:hypothetical protein